MGVSTLGIGTFLLPFVVLFYWFAGRNNTTTVITWIFLTICVVPLSIGIMTALPVMNTMTSNAADPTR